QRLPRLIGGQKALPMLLEGKRIKAADALKLGILDAVVNAGDEADARLGHAVIERAAANPEILGETETQLLIQWIGRLGLEIG
ncbi:hypothetical protein KC219_25440, partial [Mycobacterium tuberculosis]|nr:hypothetical protein [Mycobacterium tuberculosis]